MHASTAIVFLIASRAMWLIGCSRRRLRRWEGLVCSGAIASAGAIRLAVHARLGGVTDDTWLFPDAVSKVAAVIAPLHVRMGPITSTTFILLGLTLGLTFWRPRRSRTLAFMSLLGVMVIAMLTITRFLFFDPLVRSMPSPPLSMGVLSAVAFAVCAGGISFELCLPGMTGEESLGEAANPFSSPRSLSNSVRFGFGSVIVMLCVVGICSYQSLRQYISDSTWENHTYQVLAKIDALHAQLKDAESSERGYVITGNESYHAPLRSYLSQISTSQIELKAMTADNPSQQRRLETLAPLVQQKVDLIQHISDVRQQGGFDPARAVMASGKGVALMNAIHRILGEMTAEENDLLASRLAGSERNADHGIVLIVSGSVLALAVVVASGEFVIRQIVVRERAQSSLRASESMFRGLLQSAPDALVIVDHHGTIKLVNEQTENLFGYQAGQLIGQPIELIVPDRFVESHVKMRNTYLAGPVVRGMGVGQELFGKRQDGSEFPVEISLSPLLTPEGLHVSSAIRDVSRRKKEEQALARLNRLLLNANAQLESANKELESFSYSVSHDLRTPLRSIDGFSQALLEDYADKLDSEGRDHLNRVRAASQRMGHLIDDMLNLSRVTRQEMKCEPVDLTRLAREIAGELREATPERDAEFVIADGLTAHTDPRLMRIVLTNLLGNAWKFTSKRLRSRIEFGCLQSEGVTTFYTRDNGAGFDSKYTDKLFGAFQRLHSNDDFPGTGVGLATVQRIVHRQGGKVWAEGTPGLGATFYFTL